MDLNHGVVRKSVEMEPEVERPEVEKQKVKKPEREALLVKLEKDIPELTANWISYYTLHWLGRFLNLGSKIKAST